jgi:hypothetical protein
LFKKSWQTVIYLKKEATDKLTRIPTREIVTLTNLKKVKKMKYKVSKILTASLALPLMLALNISQSLAATGEDKIDVDREAIDPNSELSILMADGLAEALDNWLKLDGKFPRSLSLEDFGIKSPKQKQESLLVGDDYQSKECRRYGICES